MAEIHNTGQSHDKDCRHVRRQQASQLLGEGGSPTEKKLRWMRCQACWFGLMEAVALPHFLFSSDWLRRRQRLTSSGRMTRLDRPLERCAGKRL